MTDIKVYRSSVRQRSPHPRLLEVLVRSLIILSTVLSLILSSVAVCDGLWLRTPGGHTVGLWRFCTTAPVDGGQDRSAVGGQQMDASAASHCIPQLSESCVEVVLGCCRALVSLAVGAAIFGLECQVISQLSHGQDSARRWVLGSVLMLAAAAMSASGVFMFVALLRGFVSLPGFTLVFWCQVTAVFLFFLSGLAARHVHATSRPRPGHVHATFTP